MDSQKNDDNKVHSRLGRFFYSLGAVHLAALFSSDLDVKNKKIGLIISGGNIDLIPFFKHLENSVRDT